MTADTRDESYLPSVPDARPGVDFQRCEDEPIRTPGSIQRHGFLLLLDSLNSHIVAASANTSDFLEVPLELLLGAEIESIFEREVLGALRALVLSVEQPPGAVSYLGAFQMRGKFYTVVTSRSSTNRIVEFELLDRLVSPDMTNQVFSNFVGLLSQLGSEQELCDALTRQVRDLTHFNRILLYRFDEVGHGTVISEENDGVLPSYLGLRFPASDIPPQARELYVLNTVRIIPDANYLSSPLRAATSLHTTNALPAALGESAQIAMLDLSNASLRSVSPIHLEYMRNMGTLSSMSISIVCEGRLWGLISAHHATPRTVPYLVRSACDLLTKLVCTQLVSIRSSASLKKMVHFHGVQRRVLTHMAAENNYINAMADQLEEIMQIADAEGCALVVDGRCRTVGNTPDATSIRRLAAWMDEKHDMEAFESRHLAGDLGWAQEFSGVASGLLAIRISYVRQSYLMWFRPEVLKTVRWAGELASPEDKTLTLRPRTSFAIWKEQVSGTSARWTEMEIESAKDFRGAVMTISLKRAEEAIQLGEARFLQLTNALPHPVWTADDDGSLTYVNQKWLDQGLQNGGRWYEQDAIVKEDQTRCAQTWEASVTAGTAFELEVRFCPEPDRVEHWNLVRAIPYLRNNGTRAGWVGTCTDLTDRRQREAALRMTEKLALTGRMTSVIAHEINNPLESITNLLYLIGGHVKEDKEASSYIGLAESELRRISGITKQTLRWARQDHEKAGYGSVSDLVQDVLRLYAGKIKNKEVKVVVASQQDFDIYGTLGQISQVFSNLVSNAVQAVAVGGHLWLDYAAQADVIEVTVRDDGQGMSEETLRNLFQPFYSTKGDLGNGLGLYISREIVERHGGTISVASVSGTGTTIAVRLPAHP